MAVALKSLVVKGCTLQLSAGTAQKIKITNDPSKKVKCDGKETYFDKIVFEIKNYTGTNITNGDGMAEGCIISGSAQSVFVEGGSALLENDESEEITVIGTQPAPGGGSRPAQDIITVKVSNAGQSKVKGS